MKLCRSLDSIPKCRYAVTIGNYDGVHRGHQAILSRLNREAKKKSLATLVMTFLPSPEAYFQGVDAQPKLSPLSDRFFALRQCGVDVMFAMPFNQSLAEMEADVFIEKILIDALRTEYLLVGDDFYFGHQRKGDIALLEKRQSTYGYKVEQYKTVLFNDERVSSTRIRQCLADGNLSLANALLGRLFSISGKVCHGDKRGREWGFPTLNIPIKHKLPMTGIFAVKTKLRDGIEKNGVASLGRRPNIDDKILLEVYLFDFDGDLYGQRVCVEFVEKIRDEKKFDSIDMLKQQIKEDCDQALFILQNHS